MEGFLKNVFFILCEPRGEIDMSHIITVSREFGSGGRELGKRLADALGFSYFDREIVTALAAETGLDEEYLANSTETGALSQFPIHFARSFTQIPTVPNEGRICSPVSGSGHITVSDAAEP